MASQLPGRTEDDEFIDRRGISIDWQQSMFCPCYDIRSGQPNYDCAVCFGWGRLYMIKQTIKTLITNVRQDKSYSITGVWELGTCRCTPMANITIGSYDRIIFSNLILTFTELITRKERASLGVKDLLRFASAVNILQVKTLTTTYVNGTHYKLTTDTNNAYIEWLGATKPADGQQYSILYEHRPEFIAWDVPQIRSDSDDIQLPKFAVLRRRDMISTKVL